MSTLWLHYRYVISTQIRAVLHFIWHGVRGHYPYRAATLPASYWNRCACGGWWYSYRPKWARSQ